MTEGMPWHQLLYLMVHGPSIAMSGRIREVPGQARRGIGWVRMGGDPHPVFARGAGDEVDAWCWGDRFRLAEPDGRVTLICDGVTAWSFGEPDAPALESPRDHVELGLTGTDLLVRSTAERWLADDFTRPTGAPVRTTYLGRDAWEVELAPPSHKPSPMQVVVDAESGMVLQQRNDAQGYVSEWSELTVSSTLDVELFTWDGPVVSWDAQRRERHRELEAEQARRDGWALEQLGTESLVVSIEARLTVHRLEDDGTLYASLQPIGSLLRRPASEEEWPEGDGDPEGDEPVHRWRADGWDWALHTWEALVDGSLEQLQVALARSGADRRG